MEKEHLHLFINEEIYLISQDEIIEGESIDVSEEVQESSQVAEPEPVDISALKEQKPESKKEEHHHESPHIPIHDLPETKALPFAVFHTSHDLSENELLHKIIDACKLPEDQYKIFSNGFDQEVKFKKALVFVPEAKVFYTPIPYKGSEFLCSKPLADLAKDQNEKAKLWGALQKFLL